MIAQSMENRVAFSKIDADLNEQKRQNIEIIYNMVH